MDEPVQPERELGVRRADGRRPRRPHRRLPRPRRGGRGRRPTSSRSPMRPRWETCEVSESDAVPRAGGPAGRRAGARARLRPARRDVRGRARRGPRAPASASTSPTTTSTSVGDLLTHERVVLGLSDAGAHVGQLCDAPLHTDLLGTWVRERGVMPLERAVRKLSGEPADMFGFVDRGYLRDGRVGRRVRVRPGHGRARPAAARARLPGGRRAPHRRGADRRAPRAGQRHADPRDEVQLDSPTRAPARARRSPDGAVSPEPQRTVRKKVRRSSTNSSGCSMAAKWPPRGITAQWVTL